MLSGTQTLRKGPQESSHLNGFLTSLNRMSKRTPTTRNQTLPAKSRLLCSLGMKRIVSLAVNMT